MWKSIFTLLGYMDFFPKKKKKSLCVISRTTVVVVTLDSIDLWTFPTQPISISVGRATWAAGPNPSGKSGPARRDARSSTVQKPMDNTVAYILIVITNTNDRCCSPFYYLGATSRRFGPTRVRQAIGQLLGQLHQVSDLLVRDESTVVRVRRIISGHESLDETTIQNEMVKTRVNIIDPTGIVMMLNSRRIYANICEFPRKTLNIITFSKRSFLEL